MTWNWMAIGASARGRGHRYWLHDSIGHKLKSRLWNMCFLNLFSMLQWVSQCVLLLRLVSECFFDPSSWIGSCVCWFPLDVETTPLSVLYTLTVCNSWIQLAAGSWFDYVRLSRWTRIIIIPIAAHTSLAIRKMTPALADWEALQVTVLEVHLSPDKSCRRDCRLLCRAVDHHQTMPFTFARTQIYQTPQEHKDHHRSCEIEL